MIRISKFVIFGAIFVINGCGSDSLVENDNQQPDPVVVDIPIAYIQRTIPIDEDGGVATQSLIEPNAFRPGAALYVKARASANTPGINITDALFAEQLAEGQTRPQYDVKDLVSAYDGSTLLFAMRAPEIEGLDEDEQPTWNIWEYIHQSGELRRIIASDIQAEAGQDTSPAYLPDGRIVFTSTRQRDNQSILLDEGKPQYAGQTENRAEDASVLHVMNADGGEIQQLSFNQSHDFDPVVLSNGRILFSRWDRAASDKGINLYQINPDGSSLEIWYGRHSHFSEPHNAFIEFSQMREMPNGQILAQISPRDKSNLGADWTVIDTQGFIDNTQPTAANPSLTGPAQVPALFANVQIDGSLSAPGTFNSVYPLWDGTNRMLFSWSQCRVYDPDAQETDGERPILPCSEELLAREDIEAAPVLYGIWMYDPIDNTQLLIVPPEEGLAYTEVTVMESRAYPTDYVAEVDPELAAEDAGVVHIRSAYDLDGEDIATPDLLTVADPSLTPASARPARFLRIVKPVSLPDDEVLNFSNSAFGRAGSQLMREILGYVPIEPDGSVRFKMPARVPFAISVVDAQGKRISSRHQNWMQVMPGEVRECNGCHQADSVLPHGRKDAEAASINFGAATTGQGFANTNPQMFTDVGETMAEVRTRIQGLSLPSADIHFEDVWADPALQTPEASYQLAYVDMQTDVPVTASCGQNWTVSCRIEIHYPQHIQPLFDLPRQVLDSDGVTVLQDNTCTTCHNDRDIDDVVQVPAAQLDLTDKQSLDNNEQLTSFRELMFGDNEQEVIDGVLLDRLIPALDSDGNPIYERDENGELILDADGNPIPVMVTVGVANVLSPNGARSSAGFFSMFEAGGSHQDWLSPSELRLVAEWLDIGGQYYNNPFQVPAN